MASYVSHSSGMTWTTQDCNHCLGKGKTKYRGPFRPFMSSVKCDHCNGNGAVTITQATVPPPPPEDHRCPRCELNPKAPGDYLCEECR